MLFPQGLTLKVKILCTTYQNVSFCSWVLSNRWFVATTFLFQPLIGETLCRRYPEEAIRRENGNTSWLAEVSYDAMRLGKRWSYDLGQRMKPTIHVSNLCHIILTIESWKVRCQWGVTVSFCYSNKQLRSSLVYAWLKFGFKVQLLQVQCFQESTVRISYKGSFFNSSLIPCPRGSYQSVRGPLRTLLTRWGHVLPFNPLRGDFTYTCHTPEVSWPTPVTHRKWVDLHLPLTGNSTRVQHRLFVVATFVSQTHNRRQRSHYLLQIILSLAPIASIEYLCLSSKVYMILPNGMWPIGCTTREHVLHR